MDLEISSPPLLFLDRDEQRLKVAFSKTFAALSLEDLVEHRRPVLDGFGKDLQQIALFVAVDEDAEAFELTDIFVDTANAVRQFFVVGVGDTEEFDAVPLQFFHRTKDVAAQKGEVL